MPGGIGISVTGFVENITFSHVVIRSFDLKQVWITHENFHVRAHGSAFEDPLKLALTPPA